MSQDFTRDPTPLGVEIYTAIVATTAQSVGLTRASIPATTPEHLLSAPREVAGDYLRTSGPVVLFPVKRAGEVAKLLGDLRIPYRVARR